MKSRMHEDGLVTMNSRTMVGENSPADMEVLMEIEDVYLTCDGSVDPSRYVLQTAPVECTAIEEMFVRLKRQQQVVSNKALHLITQKRDHCDREFSQITVIQQQLEETIATCRQGRKELDVAKTNLTTTTFEILANFRKRQIVQGLLKSLHLIRHLRQVEEEVQQLVNNKEYDGAIELVLAGQRAAADHKHFKCVSSLTQRLQDTLVLAEEQLDGVLARVCYKFEAETFTKLQRAYSLLDKTQVAMDQLHMHFTSAINNSALEALKLHQKDPIDTNAPEEELKLKDLCAGIKEGNVVVCLLDLCERLWAVMLSYYHVVEWHSKHHDTSQDNPPIHSPASEFEANVNKEYVRQKLQHGLNRIWQDVQSKLSIYLTQSGLPQYPFEKFVQVLGILKRMTEVAEEFCGDTSESLQSFIKIQSLAYLKNYHAGRMEVLRIFLENEGWEMCPVKSSFNVLHLQEFEKIRRKIKNYLATTPVEKAHSRYTSVSTRTLSSDASSSVHSQDDSLYVGKYFTSSHKHTPFHVFRSDNIINEDILDLDLDNELDEHTDISDDEEPEELTGEFVDENPSAKVSAKKHIADPVIVTNTTLSVLRDCGQYIQMCIFLKAISFEVIMMMSQMFDYYLYSVHLFFASDLKVSSTTLYSQKINSVLKRIGNNISLSENHKEDDDDDEKTKLLKPTFAQIIDLEDPQHLHGLAERIVAVESLIFLSKQFEMLQPYLESLVSPHQRIILQTFFEQTVSSCMDVRLPVYMCVASQTFNVRNVLISMTQVNWEVKNVMSQHSNYVDLVVRDLQVFSMRLDQISHRLPISKHVHTSLWSCVAKFVIHTLVEGFSNVSKCSDSGRGLMQLDYTQLLSKLEKISGLKPIPYHEYVDTYVKAYYMTKPSLEDFIKDHGEYSIKHLTALVNCACDSKKTRQELISVIEGKDTLSPSKTNS